MKPLILSVFCTLAALAQPCLGETRTEASADATDELFKRCYGGLEDGKVVVREEELRDAASQTTHRRCRIDGGSAERAPRSPSIAASRRPIV